MFFWPKDFTFVCPTEIAAFGKLNGEFNDRDAVVYGVEHRQRVRPSGLAAAPRRPARPAVRRCSPTSSASSSRRSASSTRRKASACARPSSSIREGVIRFVVGQRPQRRPQSAGSAARPRRAADRRAVPVQLAEGRGRPEGRLIIDAGPAAGRRRPLRPRKVTRTTQMSFDTLKTGVARLRQGSEAQPVQPRRRDRAERTAEGRHVRRLGAGHRATPTVIAAISPSSRRSCRANRRCDRGEGGGGDHGDEQRLLPVRASGLGGGLQDLCRRSCG